MPALLLAVVLTALPRFAPPENSLIIMHATVVPMETDDVFPGFTVVVRNGRIAWMGPDEETEIPVGAEVIDGRGAFLLPGLADMHVHASAEDFPGFLAAGVTTIREMNGTPDHLAWREEIAAGERLGPRLVVTGPLIAGEEQRWRHALARTPAEAEVLVREHARLGYDAVKVYDGLSAEVHAALAATANEMGIPFVGHVPASVGLDGVLDAGQAGIEHANQVAGHPPDPASFEGIARRISVAGAWVTPTLASLEALALAGSPAYAERLEREDVALVDAGLVAWWRSLAEPVEAERTERRLEGLERMRELTRALAEAGVPLLAGTDTPNPLMIPGSSLHDEIRNLVAAGLSPYEAIRTATAAPARFLGEERKWGTITEGARADLLLVRGDPLQDVGALADPVGVVVAGRWLPADRLARLVEEAR